MITDRTQQDVDEAIAITEKIKKGETLTESEILTFERGFVTINTLNRIESKQAEIAQILRDKGYLVNIVNKQWTYNDIFDLVEHNRLIGNVDKLRDAFHTYKLTPDTPYYLYEFRNMNDFEQILVDIEMLINNMSSAYIFASDDVYLGGI